MLRTIIRLKRLRKGFLTTTQSIEGRTIVEYKGIVFGEVISGVNFLKDFGASIRNCRKTGISQRRGHKDV